MEKETTKKQIVEAARALFAEDGYKKVSMEEIARKVGIVKSTIYIYFKDKEDLLKYFIMNELSNMKGIIEKNQHLGLNFFDEVHKTILELLRYRQNQRFLLRIAREAEELKTPSTKESIMMINNLIVSYVEKRIDTAIEAKEIKKCNSKLMAFLVSRVYSSLVFEWPKLNGGQDIDESEITNNLELFLKEGLLLNSRGI